MYYLWARRRPVAPPRMITFEDQQEAVPAGR
jgi:hypothetical protein